MKSSITKLKFKDGLALEIEVLSIADTVVKHEKTMSTPHRAEFYHIFWLQKGTAKFQIDFQPVEVKAGSFLFVSKDRVQVMDYQSKHDGKLLLFTDNFFAKDETDTKFLHSTILFNDLLEIPVINVKTSAPLQTIFHAIETELLEENDNFHYNILHNLLHNLLLSAERERNEGSKDLQRL